MTTQNFKEKYEEEYNKLFISNKSEDEEDYEIESENKTAQKEYISKNPNELAQFFKEEGNRFFFKRQFDVALIYFTKALEYEPENKIFYSNRSACHLAKGNYKMALKDAERSISIDPNYVKGYYRGALANYEMNKFEEALELIKKYKEKGVEDDIDFLLNNIKKKQKEIDDLKIKFPSSSKFLEFTNWLHEADIHFSKLEIEFYTNDFRGVVAKQDIAKDEIILRIPKDMLISLEIAKNTTLGEQIASFMYIELNSPKHCLLTSFLLTEKAKGKKSFWKNYLEILPKDYSSFPIYYNEEDMSLLNGSPFKNQIIEKKEDIKKDYETICGYIPEFENFSFNDFCEGRMAVSSRIFGVKIDFKKTDVLAPFADLLNHKRPRTTHWHYDERYKSFIVQSLDDIPKGTEVKF
jgi:histone-lysine N-methyltransferase SETD3